MAEIKSTLDLVMERTRSLSVTDKEKKEMKNRELSRKIQSLLEKYSNDYMGIKWLEAELNNMGMKNDPKIRETLKIEILNKISSISRLSGLNPTGDRDKLLEVLEGVVGISMNIYRAIISEYDRTLEQRKKAYTEKIKAGLSLQKISGSAILPNLAANPDWAAELEKMSENFRQKNQISFRLLKKSSSYFRKDGVCCVALQTSSSIRLATRFLRALHLNVFE